MPANIGYATDDAKTPLAPREFDRDPVGPEDVLIDIAYCGVCHSDVHQARDEFDGDLATNFPCMPGHEIVGTVAQVGADVSKYSVGDRVGVGCLVYWGDEKDRGVTDEQYQETPAIFTYNAKDPQTGTVTFGGYSDQIVVNEHFVLSIPDAIASEKAAPILCAGVTTWAPLKRFGVGPDTTIGIAGIGGLGHMAIQLAKGLGATVVALTTTAEKAKLATDLGADSVIVMTDEDAVEKAAASLDIVLSTIPTGFDLNPYIGLIRTNGTFVSVGMLEPIADGGLDYGQVSLKRITLSGSLIGNLAETQEVLDFAAEHNIAAEVQIIPIQNINDAFDEIVDKDVHFRYVIDSSTLRS